jgi:hypothetical protein
MITKSSLPKRRSIATGNRGISSVSVGCTETTRVRDLARLITQLRKPVTRALCEAVADGNKNATQDISIPCFFAQGVKAEGKELPN